MSQAPNYLHVLLVEDDPGDAELVRIALASAGTPNKLSHAASLAGAMACKRLDEEFEIILLDLSLPDSSGFSTVAAMRLAFPTSPIVVLTGLDDPALENRTVESGAQDYLLKGSFDGQDLMRAIRHAIARHRLERKLVTSESEHRTVVDLAPDAILVVSPGLSVTSANPAAAKIFALDRTTAMIGLPLARILPDAEGLLGQNADEPQVRGDGRGIRGGSSFPVAMAIARLQDGSLLVMATDITERARLTEELQQLARTDPLTGLANRRAFISAIENEFRRSKRFASPAAVLMIDVDHFKQVNDIHGHESGDRALVSLGKILTTMARATDLPARFGGEEFVVLLTGTDLPGGVEMAERIRAAISETRVASPAGDIRFTVSVGVTTLADSDASWSDTIRRADQALYRAKASGRNAVVANPPDPRDGSKNPDKENDAVVEWSKYVPNTVSNCDDR